MVSTDPKSDPDLRAVSPSTFYGGKPVVPARSIGHGSKHTSFATTPPPPSYSTESMPYRTPELVEEALLPNSADPAAFIHQEPTDNYTWNDNTNADWNNSTPKDFSWWMDKHTKIENSTVPIDGRYEDEEAEWWNATERAKYNRPGPGFLPSMLPTLFHDPTHTISSIQVKQPVFRDPSIQDGVPGAVRPPASSTAPTDDELRDANPHPNAYYCRKHGGWIIVFSETSADLPPTSIPADKLPDQERRNATRNCVEGSANLTHHYHRYQNAVDAKHLQPPLQPSPWNENSTIKQRRRGMTINIDEPFDVQKLQSEVLEERIAEVDEPEGLRLDLYVCCQCQLYFLVSDVIPGVISPKLITELEVEKQDPPVGKHVGSQVLQAWETILKIIQNLLWEDINRPILTSGQTFQNKIGWTEASKQIFPALGYRVELVPMPKTTPEVLVPGLVPPNVSMNSEEGRSNRAKLLRAWVELSANTREYARLTVMKQPFTYFDLSVQVDAAQDALGHRLGLDKMPRERIPGAVLGMFTEGRELPELGMNTNYWSFNMLAFAYLAQCRCEPSQTMEHYTSLCKIVAALHQVGNSTESMQVFMTIESTRDSRFTKDQYLEAGKLFGFWENAALGALDDVDDEYVGHAWKYDLSKAMDAFNYTKQKDLNDALKMLAQARGSTMLMDMWEKRDAFQTPAKAYQALGAQEDVDEDLLIAMFMIRVEDNPSESKSICESLAVIANARNSPRLRQLAATGVDPGNVVAPTPPELPRGLNQLGNTCYLNSLLQFLYTIKDLREAIFDLSTSSNKTIEHDKLTDADLLKHRVGGRLVTRREITRSKEFVSQLGHLFKTLKFGTDPAITPELKLAKLALVTSKDEEEEEADKGDTVSSNDTDTTLVEDGTPIGPVLPPSSLTPPTPEPSKVLGKRPRVERQWSAMDVDDAASTVDGGYVMVASSPTSSVISHPQSSSPEADVEMSPPSLEQLKPPPLPPRKSATTTTEVANTSTSSSSSSSAMMFGKQHDVAECMDNCIFQIETALLKFGQGDDDAKSIVKKLFYGTLRQRIAATPKDPRSQSSVHSKDDMFSHLPVNVTTDGVDLYDGLSRYFGDVVDFEGKEARMEVSLVDLPPLIQIQLQRVQFNRDISQAYKSQAYIQFGETLNLDRFLETADPVKKSKAKAIQEELDACRLRTEQLTKSKGAPFAPHMRNILKFTATPVDLDIELHQTLLEESGAIEHEILERETRTKALKAQLEEVWAGEENAAYELTSVFIHRGDTPFFGHYFFYSRNLPHNRDQWFKYNDSDVTIISKEEVLADTTGQTANPYLLVYARKGLDVVDTVMRAPP